ncbi:marine proteobacterial sortase target protein [Gammaproteobacteria bacterium]|nr:marine proteobacterial sortase target protein [Gammaproteobacteria bacterium]
MFRYGKPAWPRYRLVIAILILHGGAATAGASALPEMQAGTLLLHSTAGYVPAVRLDTDVNIVVNGLVARVSLMQQFENTSSEWVEGTYVFPLPDRAAVDHMRLYIGDRLIEGEIREKEQARREYQQARQAGSRTSLVEQQRANLFTTSVANIGPGESVIVEVEYLEDLRYDEGTFSLRFPMTLTPRYSPGDAATELTHTGASPAAAVEDDAALLAPPMVPISSGHNVSLRVSVNAGLPLEIIASRYHPVNVAKIGGRYAVSLAGGRAMMDRDFELVWRPVSSSLPRALAFTETVAGDSHYLVMVIPPEPDASAAPVLPREMIFVVDTSGSMHGESLEQAKQALRRALEGLRPGDRFNVIEFNSETRSLFSTSKPADAVHIDTAQDFVAQLEANGGTEMYPALEVALRTQPAGPYLKQIIFITDGAVGNEETLFSLIATGLNEARLFTVGIGSAPNSWFMRKAAEAGRGAFLMIGSLPEVGEKMDRLFRKLEHPQVTSIDIHWPGGLLVETYPAVVPDLYRGEPVVIKAQASGLPRPGDVLSISGNFAGGAWQEQVELALPEQSPGVGALWARARIAGLADGQRRGADAATTRDAIVETALAHHLVSKYTSLVAVDRTPARPAGGPLSGEQVANLTPHGQRGAAVFGFPATATDGAKLRLTGLAAVLAALLLAMPAMLRSGANGRSA